MLPGDHTISKARNAFLESTFARDQAKRDAIELSRQAASREHRALKRSTSKTVVKRARSTRTRPAKPPAVKVTRHTTVNFQRKVSRPAAMKMVKMSSSIHSDLRRPNSSRNNRKGLRSIQRPLTPTRRSGTAESDSEGTASPNITPASLRSASRKSTHASPSLKDCLEKGGSSNTRSSRYG